MDRSHRIQPAREVPPNGHAEARLSGAKVIRELAVFASDGVVAHPLPESGSVSIGRASDNDICINHRSVSRRHAILHVGPQLRLEDLGGTNATFVRASGMTVDTVKTEELRQVSKQIIDIAPGEYITLGSVFVVVRRTEPAEGAPSAGGRLPSASHGSSDVVLRDPAMRALYEQAYLAAPGRISVLLLGETGTGKEVLAQAIHRRSSAARARGPFLGLNCAALSESLLESELFGHEKGAFTGAVQARPGLFEAADGGTVFLDEVGELPQTIQVKLLRVLEEHQVLRVGGRVPRSIDVRFLSATHRDLEADVARGAFRQDLYFRLNGVTLTIPPLRQRAADIAPLAELFAARACKAFERSQIPALSGEAIALLERYAWPGNIRELRNVMERAVMLCAGDRLLPEHLPPKMTAPAAPAAPAPGAAMQDREAKRHPEEPMVPRGKERSAPQALASDPDERQRIVEALEKCVGNQTYAAKMLGISRRTLVSKIEKYNLPRPRKPKETR
ncbi:sigma 54-interacting transcriptional regulator [Sorangium sp. So ce726]|uniref:sigma 54-interacting transcriptional regulator n=1 Tax=Sorangium sp. So ce726 TaxID=3133319 RepID=UPI003F5D9753